MITFISIIKLYDQIRQNYFFYIFLSPLGAVSGVIRVEKISDPVQLTFSMI